MTPGQMAIRTTLGASRFKTVCSFVRGGDFFARLGYCSPWDNGCVAGCARSTFPRPEPTWGAGCVGGKR